MRTRRIFCGTRWLFAAVLALVLAIGGFSQYWYPCLGDGNPISSPFTGAQLTNGIIQVYMGFTGTTTWGNDGKAESPPDLNDDPEESCFASPFTASNSGRFTLGMDKGSALSTQDDQCAISMGWPFPAGDFCYATLRTADTGGVAQNEVFGTDAARYVISPYVGASGAYIRAVYLASNQPILVDLRIDLLGDTWKFRWNFFNQSTGTDARTLPVGLRFGQWTAFRQANPASYSTEGDPGGFLSNLYVLVPGRRPLQTDFVADRLQLGTSSMPRMVDTYFSQSAPYPNFRQWLRPDLQHQDLTTVDRYEFMDWGRLLFGNLWTGKSIPDVPVGDPSHAMFYNPVNVRVQPSSDFPDRPGLQINQYMSIATTSSDVSLPMAVATETYPALAYDSSSTNSLRPNPFTVYAWVQNAFVTPDASTDLTNIALALSLPKGLAFAAGTNPVQTIPHLAPGDVQQVQWQVVADGTTTGTVTYRVLASAKEVTAAKTVTNQLLIPAVPKLNLHDGYNLVGIPFEFKDSRIQDILGFKPRALWWDPTNGRYVPVDSTTRGVAFWLNAGQAGVFNLASALAPTGQTTTTYSTTLQPGWELVTNPWQFPVSLGQATVIGGQDQVLPWSQAVQAGWIHGVMYSYDPDLGDYQFTQDFSTPLEPLRGYWIKITSATPVQLTWPPVFAAGVGAAPTRGFGDNWDPLANRFRLQLSARLNGGVDTQTFFGIAPDASEQVDKYDVLKAPMTPTAKVQVQIGHSDWGKASGPYAQDIRPSASRTEAWQFAVTTLEDGDVTLTWPGISKLPKDHTFRITDLQSGLSRDLRSVSAYTFHAAAGVRQFKLEMLPATPAKVLISALNLNQSRGGGVTIQYALNVPATTTVQVLTASGKVVRTIGPSDQSQGLQSRVWDTRDAKNIAMPPGTYVIAVTAVTPDGQVARVVRPHVLTR